MHFALVRRHGLTAAEVSVAGLLLRDIGQPILAAGVVDDVAGWFLLSVVSAMATVGLTAGVITTSILRPVGVVLFAAVIGRPPVRAVPRWTDRSEIFFSHRRPVHGPQVSGSASLGRGRRGADCGRRRQVRRRVHRRPEHQAYAIVIEAAGPLLAMDILTAAPAGALDHGPDAVRTFERRGDT
ncbi:hypothetical protein ACFWIJ_05160 [Streptomyces sp. NPDC127079]|uniref:hypothetical protein n=1 Tax=Streptomyces sp. NPDC127079 TaxID=3347132 RepID=UPI00365A16C5